MHRVLILGSGKIGLPTAALLGGCGDYEIHLGDLQPETLKQEVEQVACGNIRATRLDALEQGAVAGYISEHNIQALISALPFHCSVPLARVARSTGVHYFDLTEDIEASIQIQIISAGARSAFVPHCGLAPGFISIATAALMDHFERVDTVKMRVGALPLHPNNALGYSLTWSTDGLINEYGNPCYGIEDGSKVTLRPLEGLETITLDGDEYEAFNTSGGLGTLVDSSLGRVQEMNYKTMRYPGHCEKIRLLMNDLKLNDDRNTLKRILENAIPETLQDVVLIYVSVTGRRLDALFEETYVQKVYPRTLEGRRLSAIQVATAAGLCSLVDLVFQQEERYRGFVTQESFELVKVLDNRFGRCYRDGRQAPESLLETDQRPVRLVGE
ncbi:MAG: saccharopine dehydrogenase NADP-binding domain-containing protein [Candidatus Thiodiazotropha sp. (ex Monitilora ramsayi)]|nr:saccharopine dehydrogenase NADP-binding domain-containing protein [Candidatus Thiodiazotropha sp. (ex Monitilora ramsayi)]